MSDAGLVVAAPRLHHGLGNRIRVVLSAQDLAESVGREFAYVWPTGKPFGAHLDELWAFDAEQMSALKSRMLAFKYPYRDASEEWRAGAEVDRVWQIRTSQPVVVDGSIETWHERLRRLTPAPDVASRILGLSDGLRGRPYLGVMVRSHSVSHEHTLRESPLEWYLDRIAIIRREHPTLPLFVSADTPAAFDRVAAQFDGVHGVRDKGDYNSRLALHAAVADLYLLASSAHIIGPHYSSFPELAQYLAGPELRLETSQTPWEDSFETLKAFDSVPDPLRPSERMRGAG